MGVTPLNDGQGAGTPAPSSTRKRRKRSTSGRLFLYVPGKDIAAVRDGDGKKVRRRHRRKGHLDMRVRRRAGPRCDTCGRKHYPFQRCWSGPENVKRDRKGAREHARAVAESAAVRAAVPPPEAFVKVTPRPGVHEIAGPLTRPVDRTGPARAVRPRR